MFPHARVIHESRRNGFGAAMRLGYANAVYDAVWLITVDLPFPLETFDIAWPLLAQVPVVISYRTADPRSRARRTQSAIYNVLVRALLNVRAKHVNSAFKLFRREIIQALPLSASGWLLDAEILMLLEERRVPYIEIPVPLIDRSGGRSSVGWGAGLRVLVDLLKLATRTGPWRQRL
jgi:dolichol-phosphate mannosyltransferase